MKTLAKILSRGENNFDLIRLAAALAVMFGHSFGVQGAKQMEWGLAYTHRESFGSLAVFAFFLLSGILVSASYVNLNAPLRFIAARASRIWPGVVVCTLVTGLIIGPIFTSATLTDYFTSTVTRHWLLHNASLIGGVGGSLPGVFEHNALPRMITPTFWTLPVELECYVLVWVLGITGVTGSRLKMPCAIGLLSLAFMYFVRHPPAHFTLAGFFALPIAYSFYPVPFFFLGMLLYTYRQHVRLHWLAAVALLSLYLLKRTEPLGAILLYPTFAYGVLWIASLRQLFPFQPKHDYSYGIYLYGFVVQQAVAVLLPSLDNYTAFAVAVPPTVLLAALSWHWVERPSQVWVKRLVVRPTSV